MDYVGPKPVDCLSEFPLCVAVIDRSGEAGDLAQCAKLAKLGHLREQVAAWLLESVLVAGKHRDFITPRAQQPGDLVVKYFGPTGDGELVMSKENSQGI